MLRAYWADTEGTDLGPYMAKLSRYRLDRLASLNNDKARRQGIAAEALLIRAALEPPHGMEPPLDIVTDENGKPALRGGELFFSLSHSGDLALCAVSDSPVGADIQKLRPYNERLVSRFFAAEEREYILSSADRDRAFTEIWALKESYIKALGLGLKLPLSSFSVISNGIFQAGGWKLLSYPLEGGYAAVCSEQPAAPEFFVKTAL